MGRRRDPALKVCRFCGRVFDRAVLDDGTLERIDQYRKRQSCSDECLHMLRLGYHPKGLELPPDQMEAIINDFLASTATTIEALFIEAERILSANPREAARMIDLARRAQHLRIKVLTRRDIPVALARKSPVLETA